MKDVGKIRKSEAFMNGYIELLQYSIMVVLFVLVILFTNKFYRISNNLKNLKTKTNIIYDSTVFFIVAVVFVPKLPGML